MTDIQRQFAEDLISFLKENEGSAYTSQTKEIRRDVKREDRQHAFENLVELKIIDRDKTSHRIRLTNSGWKFPGFEKFEKKEKLKEETEEKIKELTVKQLKNEVFKSKFWWLYALGSALISAAVSFAVTYLMNQS